MDFNEFKAEFAMKYGDVDTNLSYLNKIRVVPFDVDERGNISGKIQEGLVYRHREYENIIKAGEMWVCLLQENIKGHRQYFATPIQKVDAEFIYGLRHDQMKEMAEYIWRNNRDSVISLLRDEIDAEVESKVDERTSDLSERYSTECSDLKAKVENLENEKKDMESRLDMADSLILELKNDVSEKQKLVNNCQEEIISLKNRMDRMKVGQSFREEGCIVRKESDTLYFPSLDDGRYKVCISADLSQMTIEENPRGKVSCNDGIMRIDGLNDLIPFTAEKEYDCSVDGRGRLTVSLPERTEAVI